MYSKFKDKVTLAAARYRDAYTALLILQPGGEWSNRLRPLADKDISGPGNDDDDDRGQLGEGRREMSWIWLVARPVGEEDNPEDFNQCMQAEWTKARARAQRWEEEVQLLQEEMRRVLVFLDWKAQWWLEQRDRRQEGVTVSLRSGLSAYAEKQAHMYKELALKFQNMWIPSLMVRHLHAQWVLERSRGAQVQEQEQIDDRAARRARVGGELSSEAGTESTSSSDSEDL
ncbi:hypothetical protein BC629DRAFT_1592682 [Irpex lacteus]|nr:hypothetical protein BC629DRAFT_1592682 [Irpex lacteus]